MGNYGVFCFMRFDDKLMEKEVYACEKKRKCPFILWFVVYGALFWLKQILE